MSIRYPKKNYVVFDFETTGFECESCSVIQMSAIKFFEGEKTTFNRFVKISEKLPEKIVEITGITDEQLASEGVDEESAWKEFAEFIKSMPLVGHNSINFDKKFLEVFYKKYGISLPSDMAYIDTAMLYKARKLNDGPKWFEDHYNFATRIYNTKVAGLKFNLSLCFQECGYNLEEYKAHQADSDCEMTNLIYLKYVNG